MPNATLCGKAIAEMVLGAESDGSHEYVAERLVETGNLPQGYVITKERIERCKALESVHAQEVKWKTDVKELDEMMAAQSRRTLQDEGGT